MAAGHVSDNALYVPVSSRNCCSHIFLYPFLRPFAPYPLTRLILIIINFIYTESIPLTVLGALQYLYQLRRLLIKLNHNKSNQMLVLVEGKTRVPVDKRTENQQTQFTYDRGSGNRTRAILVEDACSHHCANPASSHPYNYFISLIIIYTR